jgi:hypothetical protein
MLILIGMRHRKIAVCEFAVLVWQKDETSPLASFRDRLRVHGPMRLRNSALGDRVIDQARRRVFFEAGGDRRDNLFHL